MSNPLYQEMHSKPTNEINNFLGQVQQFKQQFGNINPREKVMECLSNGMINQQQLNQFQNFANQLSRFFK